MGLRSEHREKSDYDSRLQQIPSVGEYVYREPSVSAHFWQTAFIVP